MWRTLGAFQPLSRFRQHPRPSRREAQACAFDMDTQVASLGTPSWPSRNVPRTRRGQRAVAGLKTRKALPPHERIGFGELLKRLKSTRASRRWWREEG